MKKYIDREYVIGGASIQLRNWGNLTAEFELHSGINAEHGPDVDYDDTDATNIKMYAPTGGVIAATLKPKSSGTSPETNLVLKHPG